MANSFLSQSLSQFYGGISASPQYIFPTVQNLAAGTYISEILDIKEVIRPDGTLDAIDFYHQLTDSNGDITHFRFRYYDKELPALANSLKQYPQAKTWKDALGLQEEVTVAPKTTGSYMYIAARKACSVNVTSTSSNASATNTPPSKRGGLSSRLGSRGGKSQQTPRQALIYADEEDNDDEFDDFLDDSED